MLHLSLSLLLHLKPFPSIESQGPAVNSKDAVSEVILSKPHHPGSFRLFDCFNIIK